MLFTSNSARINNPVKEFLLDDNVCDTKRRAIESGSMKSDRFNPLTKPRSVTRYATANVDEILYAGIREFDLDQMVAFTIEELRPLEVKQFVNLEAYPHAFEQDQDVLSWAAAMMSESPLAKSLLTHAQDNGWKFCLTDLETGGFHMDISEKLIELDHYGLDAASLGRSAFFRNSLICVMAKALRDIWHEMRWGGFEIDFKPEAVLMLERARAADTDSLAVIIGWELRGAGYSDVWRHILGSEESDMAEVLTNILDRYPTALYNGMALAHVFRQWYADIARVDALDHSTLEHMDLSLQAAAIKFGDNNAIIDHFEKLSELPDGTIYLKDLGETVSRDPFFNGLQDAINQAHLFQIVYDNKVTYVDGIPFRDEALARKFFH